MGQTSNTSTQLVNTRFPAPNAQKELQSKIQHSKLVIASSLTMAPPPRKLKKSVTKMNGMTAPNSNNYSKIPRSDLSKQKVLTINLDDLTVCQIQKNLIVIDATEVVQHPKVKVTMKAPAIEPVNIQAENFARQTIPTQVNGKTQIGAASIQSNIPGQEIAGKVFKAINLASNIG